MLQFLSGTDTMLIAVKVPIRYRKTWKVRGNNMAKKRIVMALGHNALGTNLPEQKAAVAKTARVIADFIQAGRWL